MRKRRNPKTEEQLNERFDKEAQRRVDAAAVEGAAMDAMVKRSIELHGP